MACCDMADNGGLNRLFNLLADYHQGTRYLDVGSGAAADDTLLLPWSGYVHDGCIPLR